MTALEVTLRKFKFTRILSHDTRNKLVYVLGNVDDQLAILSFERAQYDDSLIPELAKHTCQLQDVVENNIYGWALGNIDIKQPDTRIKIIYPATELHVKKYEQQDRRMIVETPTMYRDITRPYIQSLPSERTQWVTNILNGTSEADRIIYRDNDPQNGFVILPDMKWDGTCESLYWVAIAFRNDITCLRDLTPAHIPLLKSIQKAAYEKVKENTNLDADQLRLFIHYQPSYYHFHVHITAIAFADAPGVVAGQAHLLDSVIDNIEMYPEYYQRATLPFVIGNNHPLYLAHHPQSE
ncbi:scavenger mrna decapping enzyme [Lichtheimia corymbifera JMRC:FSU:9682]|uniref:m7GpppX diphosphatase n=1 Tax=Lichtheimia corymbifera JMRC:FSU:9682 TaxID=1263082 RepID=A0A068S471_9FUNG|nr:scavenger mrna decapping enzyme [Lichtheimia corymbifera JMRC:FSU:9682]